MKKILCLILSLAIFTFITAGCENKSDIFKSFSSQLISPKTYDEIPYNDTDLDNYSEKCSEVFGKYLTQNGMDSLLANRIPFVYQSVITSESIEKFKNIKLTEIKRVKEKDYTYVSYEVSYEYEKDNKIVKMTDYLIFNAIEKDGKLLLDKVELSINKSSIFKVYSELKSK